MKKVEVKKKIDIDPVLAVTSIICLSILSATLLLIFRQGDNTGYLVAIFGFAATSQAYIISRIEAVHKTTNSRLTEVTQAVVDANKTIAELQHRLGVAEQKEKESDVPKTI